MSTVYFDVIVSTRLSEGVVRLGVADFIGPVEDGKRQTGEVTQLVTSLPGLIQMQAQVNQLVEKLIEKKVLKRDESATKTDDDQPIV